MQHGQTWIHKEGHTRVTLEERAEDKSFWYVTKMQLRRFYNPENPSKFHDFWSGSMMGVLEHRGNDTISDKDLLDNYELAGELASA